MVKKYREEAEFVRRLGWVIDAGGDAAIIHAPGGVKLRLADFCANELVTVCDVCYRASCWHGIFLCDGSDSAGTVDMPRAVLRRLDVENQSYFTDEELLRHTGAVARNGR